MNIPSDTLINTVPSAATLRKVPGFDPLKYLRKTVSEKTGKNVLKLDLRYKRLWFRLACPNGRMLLNPLRITDQMAIYEAMVYMSKEETEPMSRVTSTASVQDAPNGQYIHAAQDAALDEALENAGFGIQLCDFVEGAGRADYGSEITFDISPNAVNQQQKNNPQQHDVGSTTPPTAPAAQVSAPTPAPTPAAPTAQVTTSAPAAPAAQITVSAPATTSDSKEEVLSIGEQQENNSVSSAEAMSATAPSATAVPEASTSPAPAAAAESVEDTAPDTANKVELTPMDLLMGKQSSVIPFPGAGHDTEQVRMPEVTSEPATASQPMPQTTAEAAPAATYTAEMTIEEIKERMTLDEAKAVVVSSGVCKGWTIAQVAERRAASLRFFLCAPFADNILKAASQMMLEQVEKAG